MGTRLGLLLLAGAVSGLPAQTRPPLRLVLDHTIDTGSGVTFGAITNLDIGLDGSVAAVDEANGRIYRFTPSGTLRDSMSHRGQGPGEFLAAAGLAIGPAGELALADLKTRRLTFWAPDGRLLGSAPVREGAPVDLLWRGADPLLGIVVTGDSATVGFFPVQFGTGQTAGPWMGRFVDLTPGPAGGAVSCGSCRHALSTEGKLVVAAPDTFYRVSEVDATGRVLRRWGRVAGASGLPDAMGGAESSHRPRFQGIGLDPQGRLLALVSHPGSRAPVVDVFDGGGKFLGSVVTEQPLQSLVVRGSRVVALGESAEGEPVIYVFRIEEVP